MCLVAGILKVRWFVSTMLLLRSLTCLNCRRSLKCSYDFSYVFLAKRCLATAAKDEQLPKESEGTASSLATKTKKSRRPFVKDIFAGVFDQEMLLYPELPNERLFDLNNRVTKIEEFLKENVDSKSIDENKTIPEDILEKMKEFQLFGQLVPAEYGGSGLGATEYARISEVEALDSSLLLTLDSHNSLGVQGLLLYGTEEQKQKYLPLLSSGEWVAAFCLSEDISGTDAAVIETLANPAEDNESVYIVNGKKLWVTNGSKANLFIVLVKHKLVGHFGPYESYSLLLIERSFPGIAVSEPHKMIGLKGADVCQVTFKDTPVPRSNTLSTEGNGFEISINIMTNGHYAYGAHTAAKLKSLLTYTVQHLITRKQYDMALVDREWIQKKLVDVLAVIYTMESMAYLTTGILDTYDKPDCSLESAIVKTYSLQYGKECVDICADLFGGRSCMKDFPLERHLRDFRTLRMYDGTLDINKLYIALIGLQYAGEIMKDEVKKSRNPLQYSEHVFRRIFNERRDIMGKPKLQMQLKLQLHPTLAPATDLLEYCVLRFQYAVKYMLRQHGQDVVNQQLDLMRLADIITLIYAMTAVLGRASRAYCTGIANAESEVAIAQKVCNDAHPLVIDMVNKIINGPLLSGESFYYRLGKGVLKNKGYYLEHPLTKNIY